MWIKAKEIEISDKEENSESKEEEKAFEKKSEEKDKSKVKETTFSEKFQTFAIDIERNSKIQEDIIKKKAEEIRIFQQTAKEDLLILDKWIDSGVLPIQRNEEGEWVYTRTTINFDHTKTFGRIKVVSCILELAMHSIRMCINMKSYLLENELNSCMNDTIKIIYDIQAKLLILQEAFIFYHEHEDFHRMQYLEEGKKLLKEGKVQNINNVADLNELYDEIETELNENFDFMKQGIEKISEIKNFTYNYILNEAKKTTNGNQIVSNAVANAYLFQCLEWEKSVQLWLFANGMQHWIDCERRGLRSLADDDEFEIYDAEQQETRIITIRLVLEELFRLETRLQWTRMSLKNVTGGSFPMGTSADDLMFLIIRRTQPVEKLEFVWSPIKEWIKSWQNSTKRFEQQRELLKQEVEDLEEQLDKKKNLIKEEKVTNSNSEKNFSESNTTENSYKQLTIQTIIPKSE